LTVSTTNSQITVGCNGSTNLFTFPFIGVTTADIALTYTNTSGLATLISPSLYSVAINPPLTGQTWGVGGTVTYPLSGPNISSGSLTISRILPLTQQAEIGNQGNQYPIVTEEALDILCMEIQQVSARTGKILGVWVSGNVYNNGDIVTDGVNGANTGNLYACVISNTAGTWATDLANGDWTIALNVQGIINSNPAINNNNLFANISGSSIAPYGVGASAFLDSAFSSTQGSLLYRSGSAWVALAPGSSGQFLKTNGGGANPAWASAAGAGTVTSVATNNGLTGGTITTTGTIGLATVADSSILANVSSGTAAPSATTLSAILDHVLGSTQGDIIYRGGSVWAALAPGSAGQVLISGGAGANPSWNSGAYAPAISLYQTTGKALTGSAWTAISFDTESYKDISSWHNNSVNNSRITVDFTGRFSLKGVIDFNSAGNAVYALALYQNGSLAKFGMSVNGTGGASTVMYASSWDVPCSSGDYFELYGYTNAAGLTTGSGITRTCFSAQRIG
jgi:hypothetical protein